MQYVRIFEIPDCKMVSSGIGMFGDGVLEKFDDWFSKLPRGIYPKDFLFWDCSKDGKEGFHWLYVYEEGMRVPEGLSVIDFKGGLYAVTTDIDQETNMDTMNAEINAFLNEHGLERDVSRKDLGNIITSSRTKEVLGFEQMNYWTPVKEK